MMAESSEESDLEVIVQDPANDTSGEGGETSASLMSEQVTTMPTKTKSGKIYKYFSSSRATASGKTPSKPPVKKRKVHSSAVVCIYEKCLITVSRGSNYYKERHKDSHHAGCTDYDVNKHLLKEDDKRVVALKKELEGSRSRASNVGDVSCEEEEDPVADRIDYMSDEPRVDLPIRELEDITDESRSIHEDEAALIISEVEDQSEAVKLRSETIPMSETHSPVVSRKVQDILPFAPAPVQDSEDKRSDPSSSNQDLQGLHEKLDVLLANMKISSQFTKDNLPEANQSLDVLQKASNITEVVGSGISFYPGKDVADGALVRCDTCFAKECDNDPALLSSDPFFLGHTNVSSYGGKSLALGLILTEERKLKCIAGHNQDWYRFKKTLIDHISCTSSKNGGDQHLQGLIAQKRRDKRNKTILNVVCAQLKAALTVVKIKSANLHSEDLIGLLYSSGANVGNLGHGRNQVNEMTKAFQEYLLQKLNRLLTEPLPSTGFPPHFSTASDKSTPIRVTNHAIMVVVMVNGKKVAVPVEAPAVYDFKDSDLVGGTACHLAEQVLTSLKDKVKVKQESLSYLMSHQADGQYQAHDFIEGLKQGIYPEGGIGRPIGLDKFFVVPWDAAHWQDCCMGDMREKEEHGECLRRLVKRANKFHKMFGRGRGLAEYEGITAEMKLSSCSTSAYATTRFASSAFETFEKTYKNYEGLVKTYERMRETSDEEEEMRYLIKGRDFCIDLCGMLDVLTPYMNMMIRVQGLNTFLWLITILWPRIRQRLNEAKTILDRALLAEVPEFDKNLFPYLNKHYSELSKEPATACTFQNVSLTEGWMVVGEENVDDPEDTGKKKKKVYQWSDRSPEDCLVDLVQFTGTLIERMDERYESSVTEAAHHHQKFLYIPCISICFVRWQQSTRFEWRAESEGS